MMMLLNVEGKEGRKEASSEKQVQVDLSVSCSVGKACGPERRE